jgi:outer membrane protein
MTGSKLIASLALAVSLAVTAPVPLSAQETAQPLTFSQALARALEFNRTAGQARLDVDIARAQSRILLTNILPQVGVAGSVTRNTKEVTFGENDQKFTILPQDDWSYTFVLAQPVYAGGREIRAYNQSKLAVENTQQSVRAAEDTLLLGTSVAYLGAIQADALVAVERSNIELAENRRVQSQNFYEAGETTRVDVLRAVTATKAAQRRLTSAIQARENALSGLRIVLASDEPITIASPEVAIPPLPDEAALIARAEAARPEIRQAENALRIANLEVKKQWAAHLPLVTAQATYTTQKTDFPSDQFGALALNFSVPIWQSGQISQRVAQAKAQVKQAELALANVRQTVREDVRVALLELETSRTNLALAREQLAAAQAEYEQMFDLYRAQEATSLDLDAAESGLAEARRAVAIGELDEDIAELRVWYAAGSLKNVLMTEVTQ